MSPCLVGLLPTFAVLFSKPEASTSSQNTGAVHPPKALCKSGEGLISEEAVSFGSRRQILEIAGLLLASGVSSVAPVVAAETVGKDPDCYGASCLGVWDGLLADCPHGKFAMNTGARCTSSQDDTPGVFAEP